MNEINAKEILNRLDILEQEMEKQRGAEIAVAFLMGLILGLIPTLLILLFT